MVMEARGWSRVSGVAVKARPASRAPIPPPPLAKQAHGQAPVCFAPMTPETADVPLTPPPVPPMIPTFAQAKRRRLAGEAVEARREEAKQQASAEAGGKAADGSVKKRVTGSQFPWRSNRSYLVGPPSDQVPCPWMPAFEPWQSFTWSVEHWVGLLDEIEADRTAQQALFLLAQAGKAGATAANHIVAKILKKKADKEVVYSWSKFLHSCCLNARHLLEHQGWSQ